MTVSTADTLWPAIIRGKPQPLAGNLAGTCAGPHVRTAAGSKNFLVQITPMKTGWQSGWRARSEMSEVSSLANVDFANAVCPQSADSVVKVGI